MKKPYLKKLAKIRGRFEELAEELLKIQEDLDNIVSDEQSTFESRSEKWRESEKGEEADQELEKLEEVSTDITSIKESIDDIVGNLTSFEE